MQTSLLTKRQRMDILWGQMDQEIQSFLSHWKSISRVIRPRRARFTLSETNKGDRVNQDIIDSTGTMASRTLRAGMMAGVMSPARPWFRLATPDPDLNESASVKQWLDVVTQRLSSLFLKSNLYKEAPILFGDMGDFATGAMLIEEDFETLIRCQVLPIGTYRIANDENLKVGVFAREFRLTVRQVLERFGETSEEGEDEEKEDKKSKGDHYNWDNLSNYVRTSYESGNLENWVDIRHIIEPNADYDPNSHLPKHAKFSSCYYERGSGSANAGGSGVYTSADSGKYLRESGYDYFPVLCPRWEVSGEDVYGTDCPGMTALGDIRQLQAGEKKSLKAIDKMIDPPMQGPPELINKKISILPGDFTATNSREGQQGLRPIHEVQFRLEAMEQKQSQVRERIRKAYYEDIFLMLSGDDRSQRPTAMEVTERKEEKFLALGHVYEQTEQELLKPLIDIALFIGFKQGRFPEAPEELQGTDIKVELLSIMAQAQKIVGISGIERYLQIVQMVAAIDQTTLVKTDFDEVLSSIGEMTSLPPKIVRTEDQVKGIRDQQQQAAAAQQRMAAVEQASSAAKNLSQTDMSSDNALTRLTDQANAGRIVPGGP